MNTKLIKFIKNNNLDFNGSGSGLNSDCTIISGYALHLGIDSPDIVIKAIKTINTEASKFKPELERVFVYARNNNYGDYWDSDEAKSMYKF